MKALFTFLVGLSIALTGALAQPTKTATQLACAEFLSVDFTELHGDFIQANGVAITGDFIYALDMVLNNLDLNKSKIPEQFGGVETLTLGEGVSKLLPFLIESKAKAKALDLWYHTNNFPNNFSGEIMRKYIADYGPYLLQGDAQKIPLPENSVSKVLSHMLVNNVSSDMQVNIVADVIRVLRAKGEARIYGFDSSEIKLMQKFLDRNYKDLVTYKAKEIAFDFIFRGSRHGSALYLLTLDKK